MPKPDRAPPAETPILSAHSPVSLADSDARLVELSRLGDDAAFGRLVDRYERKLLRVLGRLVPDAELARDLAQETFWKVYNRLDRFDTTRRFGPWLFRVGLNLALDHLRRVGLPTTSLDRGPSGLSIDVPTSDPRLTAELHEEIACVLARLPLDYRSVLVLRDLEGFSSSEVAAIIDRREATVRWRLARARDMFRTFWELRQGDDILSAWTDPDPHATLPSEEARDGA